ncbi:MAG: hypothetical protein QOJ91_2820 [Sphingomonadales bacterium]|nr:hypothetical protein [Sphingomonadales bacterium]
MSFDQEPDFDLSPLGSLALLWPAIPDGLVGPEARSRLEAAAARLAPIARIALELRLGEGRDEVDLHQFVSASPTDSAVLKRYLLKRALEDPARRFLSAWADDSGGIRTDLDGFFLEWDGPGSSRDGPPAIFLPVEGRHDRGPEAAVGRRRVAGHIERLGLAGRRVAELLDAIPAALSISYIGFMLGRGELVRVNLRGVRPEELAGVLAGLGWPGDVGGASRCFAGLVGFTGRVAVALDFAPSIQPMIGFEASLPDFPQGEPRWRALFDHLCAEGLCTEDKRAALERLGARLRPEHKGQDWPASWIAAAVTAPAPFLPWFERRLSHVKVSIREDGEVGAKAYVSAQHHWRRGGPILPPRAAGGAPSAAASAQAAAAFLVAERDQDDFWRDFRLVNGASDEWVTAFVGYALVGSGLNLPDGLVAQTVAALLGRQRPEGGWGYNRVSPADADSTAWTLKFLRSAGYRGPEVERADSFLRSHLLPGGGISTYAAGTRISFAGADGARDDSGWRGAHGCVAANAAGLIGEPVAGFLRSSQAADGAWTAYWWQSDVFATALALEAVAADEARARALAWAAQRTESPSSAFDRAWLVRILALGDSAAREKARTLASSLAAAQRRDGGWDSSAEMLFPDPAEASRRPGMEIVVDDGRLFTAASALLALAWAREADRGA